MNIIISVFDLFWSKPYLVETSYMGWIIYALPLFIGAAMQMLIYIRKVFCVKIIYGSVGLQWELTTPCYGLLNHYLV